MPLLHKVFMIFLVIIETWWPTQPGKTQFWLTTTPATCQVWYSRFADHSYIRGMALAELEEHPNSLVNRFVLFSSVLEDSVYLFLELQRNILWKSNVFDYICALDAISAQRYSIFLWLFIKRMSQATKRLQQLFATLLAAVFVSSGQPMKK